MNRIACVAMILALAGGLAACAASAPAAPLNVPTPPALATATLPTAATIAPPARVSSTGEFDADRALEHARMLAVTIGARVAGSENAARAGEYIAQQLESYGYTIEKQTFTFESWEDRGTRAQITLPQMRALDARPLRLSPPGQVEAEVVAVGGVGDEYDFSRADAKGKIALVRRGTLPFSDKARNAERAGAAAVIIYNDAPERFAGGLRDAVTLPVLAISGREGQALLDLVAQGAVKIKIESATARAQKMGRNIVSTQRGTSDRVVVLGAHYDSVEIGAGANDNGSGAAVLLELARALAQKPRKQTLVFVAFDGEEAGLFGSRHYVAGLPDDARRQIVAMLNFDMLSGGAGSLQLDGGGRAGKLALDAARELGVDARSFSLGSSANSDHASFRSVGIDAVFFMRNYDLLHTPQDTIDQVRAEWLGEAGRVAMRVVDLLE